MFNSFYGLVFIFFDCSSNNINKIKKKLAQFTKYLSIQNQFYDKELIKTPELIKW